MFLPWFLRREAQDTGVGDTWSLCQDSLTLQEQQSQPPAHLAPGLGKAPKPQKDANSALKDSSALGGTHQPGQHLATQGGHTVFLPYILRAEQRVLSPEVEINAF